MSLSIFVFVFATESVSIAIYRVEEQKTISNIWRLLRDNSLQYNGKERFINS